jgi:FkbM family methyltransferase
MKVINNLKKFIAPEIKALIKRKLNKNSLKSAIEFEKLKQVPRYTKTSVVIDGYTLIIPDSASFLFMYDEIFREEIYKFKTKNQTPYIIDGGANIGLASIYFKKLYPNAEIVAFEPDSDIFTILKSNIKAFNFKGVKLINKGLWNTEKYLSFKSEGADAGLLGEFDNTIPEGNQVEVASLRPYLSKTVDFLKLDIEGAETVVLKDIAEDLDNVARIFVEYHSFVGQEQSLNEIIEILTKSRFRIYMSIPGNNAIKSPFMGLGNYNNMDFQLNIFGFKQDS